MINRNFRKTALGFHYVCKNTKRRFYWLIVFLVLRKVIWAREEILRGSFVFPRTGLHKSQLDQSKSSESAVSANSFGKFFEPCFTISPQNRFAHKRLSRLLEILINKSTYSSPLLNWRCFPVDLLEYSKRKRPSELKLSDWKVTRTWLPREETGGGSL